MCESSKNSRAVIAPSWSPSSPMLLFSATLKRRILSSVPPHERYTPLDDTAIDFRAPWLQLKPKDIGSTSSSSFSCSATFQPNIDLQWQYSGLLLWLFIGRFQNNDATNAGRLQTAVGLPFVRTWCDSHHVIIRDHLSHKFDRLWQRFSAPKSCRQPVNDSGRLST